MVRRAESAEMRRSPRSGELSGGGQDNGGAVSSGAAREQQPAPTLLPVDMCSNLLDSTSIMPERASADFQECQTP